MGYDAIGQVVSDNHDTNNTFDRTYAFDGIGNRTSATENTTTVNYTANSKNQYSTVGGTSRTHDADGNLTNDGKTYVYDAENRLIEVKDTGGNTVEQYEYDYLSRRITRSVYGGATVQSFIYDGWNPIAMYNAGALSQTYTWGKDLSGSMQGSGGVGGLLEVSFNSNSYYPTYDGNGNVSEYLDSSGAVVAHFEYDAFGKTVVENGSLAGNFFHRFSTKQWNPLAELYYYGYRFYAPETGRWINRDPIVEDGGLNLFGFVGNDGLNYWDVLGCVYYRCVKQVRIGSVIFLDPQSGLKDIDLTFQGKILGIGSRDSLHAALQIAMLNFTSNRKAKLDKIDQKAAAKNWLVHSYGFFGKTLCVSV